MVCQTDSSLAINCMHRFCSTLAKVNIIFNFILRTVFSFTASYVHSNLHVYVSQRLTQCGVAG